MTQAATSQPTPLRFPCPSCRSPAALLLLQPPGGCGRPPSACVGPGALRTNEQKQPLYPLPSPCAPWTPGLPGDAGAGRRGLDLVGPAPQPRRGLQHGVLHEPGQLDRGLRLGVQGAGRAAQVRPMRWLDSTKGPGIWRGEGSRHGGREQLCVAGDVPLSSAPRYPQVSRQQGGLGGAGGCDGCRPAGRGGRARKAWGGLVALGMLRSAGVICATCPRPSAPPPASGHAAPGHHPQVRQPGAPGRDVVGQRVATLVVMTTLPPSRHSTSPTGTASAGWTSGPPSPPGLTCRSRPLSASRWSRCACRLPSGQPACSMANEEQGGSTAAPPASCCCPAGYGGQGGGVGAPRGEARPAGAHPACVCLPGAVSFELSSCHRIGARSCPENLFLTSPLPSHTAAHSVREAGHLEFC